MEPTPTACAPIPWIGDKDSAPLPEEDEQS